MADENNKTPSQTDKGKHIEKGQKPEKLNENKLPDFQYTPLPPTAPKEDNSKNSD